ncbi:MAG: DUF4296 domain-containing protein [Bacteroidales bacterium]|nr:DUF4296 domain-containing protein [Bacteroidales bacterium]
MRSKVLLSVFIFSLACSSGRRKLIPEDDMVNILKEMHICEAVFTTSHIRDSKFGYTDSLNVYDSIITRYGYTTAMYDSTIKYYVYHTEKFEELYDKVIEELNKLEGEVLDSIKNRNTRD